MKLPAAGFVLFLMTVTLLAANQASFEDQMQSVKAMLEQSAVSNMAKQSSGNIESVTRDLQNLSNNLSQIDNSIQNNNFDDARRTLARMLRGTKNEQLQKALKNLLASIDSEQEKQLQKLSEKFDVLNKQADQILQKSESLEAIAKLQDDIEDFRATELNYSSRRTQRFNWRIERLNNLINLWQQMLDAENQGDYAQALQILSNIQSNSYSYRASSEIITARKRELEKKILTSKQIKDSLTILGPDIITMVAAIKTPADALAVQQKISLLENSSRNNSDRSFYNQLSNSLLDYANLSKRYAEGDYYGVASGRSNERWLLPEVSAPLQILRDNLKAQAMAKLFDLPDLGLPAKNESLAEFLHKKAEAAFKAQQWDTLYSVISAYRLSVSTPCADSSLKGCESMMGAEALEAAAQWRDAAMEYRNVLRQSGRFSPRAAATTALKRLTAEHAAEIQGGTTT